MNKWVFAQLKQQQKRFPGIRVTLVIIFLGYLITRRILRFSLQRPFVLALGEKNHICS